MSEVPIFVAGLGRCGSSLVMQMLQAAGVPCLGEFPAFEPDETGPDRNTSELLSRPGIAIKILDPHRSEWPKAFDAKIIWLDRDTKEQAKSQLKFVREVAGIAAPTKAWRQMAKGLKSDRFRCVEWWSRNSSEPLFLRFEDILTTPDGCARRLLEFVGADPKRVYDAGGCVISRKPECRKDMSMEESLIRAVGLAAQFGTSIQMTARRLFEVSSVR